MGFFPLRDCGGLLVENIMNVWIGKKLFRSRAPNKHKNCKKDRKWLQWSWITFLVSNYRSVRANLLLLGSFHHIVGFCQRQLSVRCLFKTCHVKFILVKSKPPWKMIFLYHHQQLLCLINPIRIVHLYQELFTFYQ